MVDQKKYSQSRKPAPSCRFCKSQNLESIVDLGMSPLSQNFLSADKLNQPETFYPLHTYVCTDCWLVQLEEFVSGREIFEGEYLYLSSYSDSWVQHARHYTDLVTERFSLDENKLVVEIASNDGYLLQWFQGKNIPVLGIEPSETCSTVAIEKGIPTEVLYFGTASASFLLGQYGEADLLLGNNVLAHVPDINDFVAGMKILLAKDGVITMEFPHLQRLVEDNQFDTIYHEHFSYLSLISVAQIFLKQGLRLFDVEELSTHGGSLRIYACHSESQMHSVSERYTSLLIRERELGMNSLQFYADFGEQVEACKRKLLSFLIQAAQDGKTVVGYGAAAKGNTLLNYCGIREDLLKYVVDRSEVKIGKFLPGTHIPIYAPERILETQPDYVLILPWNLRNEIIDQWSVIYDWGGKFVVPIPETQILEISEKLIHLELSGKAEH
ncbi:MAG: class I SAM-dependent methyltransferase [Bacteroidota bacterium]